MCVSVCVGYVCMEGEIQRRSACYDRVTSETGQKQLVMERKKHMHTAALTHTHISTAHARFESHAHLNHTHIFSHITVINKHEQRDFRNRPGAFSNEKANTLAPNPTWD